ncbi:TPA: hypothetical protein ACF1RY_002624 [Enterococcus hirae]
MIAFAMLVLAIKSDNKK